MLRQKVFYSGNVQGVGFRYTAARLAGKYPVEGWVRNLPDGRVELAVQGAPGDVSEFLADILAQSPGSISNAQTENWTSPLTQSGFQVRFDLNP